MRLVLKLAADIMRVVGFILLAQMDASCAYTITIRRIPATRIG
jgi:hypothetical protein